MGEPVSYTEGEKLFPERPCVLFWARIIPQKLHNPWCIPEIWRVSPDFPVSHRLDVYTELFGNIQLAKVEIEPPGPEVIAERLKFLRICGTPWL